jgi:hypothetical protein
MIAADLRSAVHPRVEMLALYATGDLPWRLRWRTGRHIKHCADCEQQVVLFRSARVELKREAETQTLTGFEAIADWTRLEREMLGNIAVGVAAARCIDNVGRARSWVAKGAFAAALIALCLAGWVPHIPRQQTARWTASLRDLLGLEQKQVAGPIIQTTPDGISVRAQGATLTIMHPRSAVVGVSGASAVQARYIDEETGQVTITNVYGQ